MWRPQEQRSRSGIAYHRAGRGPAVILLHGIPGCASSWASTVDLLPDSLDVVVPDLLGFGASDRPSAIGDLHASSQAEALAELIDEVGLGSFTVVGHDFGGLVAIALSGSSSFTRARFGPLGGQRVPRHPHPVPARHGDVAGGGQVGTASAVLLAVLADDASPRDRCPDLIT